MSPTQSPLVAVIQEAGYPTQVLHSREPLFELGDRVYFFGGSRRAGSRLYTVTSRSWHVNLLAAGGYGWYYQACATVNHVLVGEPCRLIGEEFVAWATL